MATLDSTLQLLPVKVFHYLLLNGTSDNGLEKRVQNAIDNGWQPYGLPFKDEHRFYQSVVVYDGTPEFAKPEVIKNFNPNQTNE